MPTFLRFPTGGDIVLNARHIISIQCQDRLATADDAQRAPQMFQAGTPIYSVRLQLVDGNYTDLEYLLEADRKSEYETILAVLQPTVIVAHTPGAAASPKRLPKPRKALTSKRKKKGA